VNQESSQGKEKKEEEMFSDLMAGVTVVERG